MKVYKFFYKACRIVPALILLQSLWFKFTASPESVHIFRTLGVEPVGRIFVGVMEAIAVVFLLARKTAHIGAILVVVLMLGAIFAHLTKLGISVQNDGGLLFGLALSNLVMALVVLYRHRRKLPFFNRVESNEKTSQ